MTYTGPRKTVRFALTLTEESRERLDRLAHEQGCSRVTLIAQALLTHEHVLHPHQAPTGSGHWAVRE
jgi:predicted transcriptional regulator